MYKELPKIVNYFNYCKKNNRLFFSLIFITLCSFQNFSQNNEWKFLTTIDNVEIKYQKVNCDDNEIILLSTKNTGDSSQSIILKYNFGMVRINGESAGSGILNLNNLLSQEERIANCASGIKINVFEHFTMFNEEEFTFTITKSE